MPEDLLLSSDFHLRQADAAYVFECIQDSVCCAVVGMSNIGKSALLRLLAEPKVHPLYLGKESSRHDFVLVDCNRMLELSEQGFYELVLRCILEQLGSQAGEGSMQSDLQRAYERLIHPTSAFDVPLSFNQGMTTVNGRNDRKLILLFDEFDQALAGLQGRVFLNLRALKDQNKRRLVYVTATGLSMGSLRDATEVSEFSELFTHHTYHLPPMSRSDVHQYTQRFARLEEVTFDTSDEAFIWEWAGGHPGLLEATCRALGSVTGATIRDATQDRLIHREVASWLPDDMSVRVECRKIWDQLPDEEQEGLLGNLQVDQAATDGIQALLLQKHILVGSPEELRFFSRLFGEYVQRLRATRRPKPAGIRVDVESGIVYVGGSAAPTLTKLEYRLLLLLYGRLDQIVSKYEVVEAVWGEEYIDEVDDARIEKLVSRLRNKIENDPRNPRYVTTVRGRGYRLRQ